MNFNPHTKNTSRNLALNCITLAVATLATQAQAQTAPATEVLERVQITGSAIKRLAGEAALPVSSISAVELEARGHTELKDLVLEMPQSLSLGTNSGAAGPMLNLRGLGAMRTLTLLNGRRMANEPFQDQYVSVNVIPRMALKRAETLRDGASSMYGSDAIGGVQNFLTLDSFQGFKIKGELTQPQVAGGGTKAFGLIAGVGDLNADGWNIYATLDKQRKSAIMKSDRPALQDSAVLKGLGIGLTPDNKGPSPTANFGFARTANSNYNPSFATGCLAPYSLPTLGAGSVAATPSYSNAGCYRDPNTFDPMTDGSEITNLYSKASWNLGASHKVALELLHSVFTVQKFRGMQVPSSTNAFTTYSLPSTSKFYPGNGITPAVQVVGSNTGANSPSMFIDATKTPGTVSNLNMNNRAIYFVWGPGELGSAYRNDMQTNDRMVLSAEGSFDQWDYRVGLNHGHSKRDTKAGGGYILYNKAQEGFTNGTLNPFGAQDTAGLAYLKSIELNDYTYRINEAFNQSVDATVTRELMNLAGGPLTMALSGELRRDSAKVTGAPLDYVTTVDSAGVVTKQDIVGEVASGVDRMLQRDIRSAVMEFDAPVTKMLSFNAAVRSDTYSDLKTTTVNPKLSMRFQPTSAVVLRASANTGFRAPSIMDIQNPTPEIKTYTFDDPVLCPSATPLTTNTGTPVSGYTAAQVCNVVYNVQTKSADNSFLKPETSKGWTIGAAVEPMKNMLITVDYWNIKMEDVLGALSYTEVLQNPAKYAANIFRKADGTLDYIVASQANRGMMDIRGVDLSANYKFPTSSAGTFSVQLDGTFYDQYTFTTEKGGVELQNIGIVTNDTRYGGTTTNANLATMPQLNFRWKHTASLAWRQGPWTAQVSQRFNTGLHNMTPRAGATDTGVKPYSEYGVSGSYSGIKNLKLGMAINNLFNVTPMTTANSAYSTGYITSAADVTGRAYKITAEYAF